MRVTSAWENNMRNPSRSSEWSYKLCDLTEWDVSHHSNLLDQCPNQQYCSRAWTDSWQHTLVYWRLRKKGFENNQKLSSKYPLGRKYSCAFSSVLLICLLHLLQHSACKERTLTLFPPSVFQPGLHEEGHLCRRCCTNNGSCCSQLQKPPCDLRFIWGMKLGQQNLNDWRTSTCAFKRWKDSLLF